MTALDAALFRTRTKEFIRVIRPEDAEVTDVIAVANKITIDADVKREFAEASPALGHWISLPIKPNTANNP